jgi:trk system potassium uptake protein
VLAVNLSSLNFLRSLHKDNRQYAVIGLGRFGRAACMTLHQSGYEVLGIDSSDKLVDAILNDKLVSHAIQLDSTEPFALKQAGIFEIDTVIVAIGNYLDASVITTLNLKEGGVNHVVAKASSEVHMKLLKKVGADHVVFPEHDAGCELATSLTKPSILERFEIDTENSIVELIVPDEFHGKTIMELQLRNRYGLNLLGVSQDGKFHINPNPTERLQKGSLMVVVGSNQSIERLPL